MFKTTVKSIRQVSENLNSTIIKVDYLPTYFCVFSTFFHRPDTKQVVLLRYSTRWMERTKRNLKGSIRKNKGLCFEGQERAYTEKNPDNGLPLPFKKLPINP